jgi:hypothetical protein
MSKKVIIVGGLVAVGIYLMTRKEKAENAAAGNSAQPANPSVGGSNVPSGATNPIVYQPTANLPQLKVGDSVMYKGFRYTIKQFTSETVVRLERKAGLIPLKATANVSELQKV